MSRPLPSRPFAAGELSDAEYEQLAASQRLLAADEIAANDDAWWTTAFTRASVLALLGLAALYLWA